MTQEDKELLLKDLCARLPYGVRVLVDSHKGIFCGTLVTVTTKLSDTLGEAWIEETYEALWCDYKLFKPYLFPFSSMTEEQIKEFNSITLKCNTYTGKSILLTDFCNKHHIDWRGFIEKGLALDATGLNIY